MFSLLRSFYGVDPQAEFFTLIAGLLKFMTAFQLSRKIVTDKEIAAVQLQIYC